MYGERADLGPSIMSDIVPTLPDDPLGRYWVPAVRLPDDFSRRLHQSLFVIVSCGHDSVSLVGNAFCMGQFQLGYLTLTAAHNVHDVIRHQNPHDYHHTSTLPFFKKVRDKVDLTNNRLWFVQPSKPNPLRFFVFYTAAYDAADISVSYVQPEFESSLSLPLSMNTSIPRIGEEVVVVGFSQMAQEIDCFGETLSAQISFALTYQKGVVRGVHLRGVRGMKYPLIETTIPVEPGMSGSPVLSCTKGNWGVCAIISRDISEKGACEDLARPGHSVATLIGSSYAIRLPKEIKVRGNEAEIVSTMLVANEVRNGKLRDVCNGEVHVVEDEGGAHALLQVQAE